MSLVNSKKNAVFQLIFTRLMLVLSALIIAILVLLIRVYYLQIINFEKLTTLSNDNRILVRPLPPLRGLIYDNQTNIVAQNIPSYTLSIVPERVGSLDKTIEQLNKIITISEDDLKAFKLAAKQRKHFESIPLKYRLKPSEIAKVSVDQYKLPGVEIDAQFIRYYPYGNLFTDVIGYVGRINDQEQKKIDQKIYSGTHITGKTGVERYYEQKLMGYPGYQQVEVDVRGRVRRTLLESYAKNGEDLHLYIDSRLQKTAFDAMEGKKGAVVAIDPNTGGILAMVSMPTFNPNLFVTGISHKAYKELHDDKGKPLYNRTVLGEYPPASTLKPIMALAGLDLNKITTDSKIYDKGYYQIPGVKHKYRNWKRSGHGWVDLHSAIVKSNDTFFYDLAVKLNIDNIYNYTSLFGFGKKTDIDFPTLKAGLVPSPSWKKRIYGQPWYKGETVISGIGQGFMQATPMQLAVATAILANRGRVVSPRIAKPQNGVLATPNQVFIDKNRDNWEFVVKSMADVMSSKGTGWRMGKVPFSVAGKTGTAQVINIAQGNHYQPNKLKKNELDHGLFIGFAPVDKPKIVIAVITENQTGAAIPVARKVFQEFFNNSLYYYKN